MAEHQLFEAATFVAPPPAPDLAEDVLVEQTQGYFAPKRLMLVAGRSNARPRGAHRAAAPGHLLERHAEDVPERRAVRPLRRVHPRRRRVHRAVVRTGRRDVGERLPDGAADHGRRRAPRLGQARDRRRAAVPVRAAGQEVEAARAHHGPPRLDAAQRRRRRPRADDGPARRPGAGLLRRARRPHDRAADVRAVLPRPGHLRRRGRASSRPTPAARSWRRSSPRCSTRRSRSSPRTGPRTAWPR